MKKTILFIFSLGILFLEAQNCWPPTASDDLEINNIRARLMNGGDMWWDGLVNPVFQYPIMDSTVSTYSTNLLFAGALWMTALDDINGDLKCAAQTYRNQGHDFWPGPINFGSSTISDVECTKFDRFFPILRSELNAHINAVNLASGPLSTTSIPTNVLQWPGKGNAYLLATYNMDIIDDLAPFQDCNNNEIYDPENGDYPLMKGDQSLFWVINDIGNTHDRSHGDPLGVEIQCMAYAYITSDEVNDATFYDYKVIKKTSGNLNEYYFSQFVDPDLGGFSDDYIGCDTTLNYGFCYNADNDDGVYGAGPPIVITQFLKTPSDLGISSFVYFNNCGNGLQCDPDDALGFRNFQTGLWGDGSPITYGGNGLGGTNQVSCIYSGNPGTGGGWSECSEGITPDDRRYTMTSGPYTLNATDALEFTIAVIIAETDASTYNGCPDKTTLINPVVNLVDNFIATVDDSPYACKVLSSITDFNDENGFVSIYPNPASDYIILNISDDFELSKIQIYDILGAEVNFSISDNTIDVSQMSKGVYTLKVYSEQLNKTIVKKFVLK